MRKKILFIILPYLLQEKKYARRSFLTMPYGVLSIATFIKDIADVEIFDCNLYSPDLEKDPHNWRDYLRGVILRFDPDIFAISMMFDNSYSHLSKVIQVIDYYRQVYLENSKILLGGAASTYGYKEILEDNPEIDAICYGEGEWPMYLWIKDDDRISYSSTWVTRDMLKSNFKPTRTVIDPLDNFIDLDYSLIDLERYQSEIQEAYAPKMHGKENKRQFFVITSRGCPFSCTFCINSNNKDKSIRYASVDSIIDHVENLIATHGMNVLTFYDDQILYDRARAKELFKRLAIYNLRIEMPNGISPAFIDEELAELMCTAGVDAIYLALESGSKDVLKMMHKPVNLDRVRELMPILRKYDFFVYVFLVVGIPGETDEHRKETLEFIREIKSDIISPKIASPVYGSKLRDVCLEKGYILDDRRRVGTLDITEAVINTPEYSAEYLNDWCLWFMRQINFVENYRMSIGDYKTAKHYFEYVLSKYPEEQFAQDALKKVKELMK